MEFNATFIVSAISFIVFSIIMNWIFYKPIRRVVDERQELLDEHHKEAALAKEKAESLLTDKEKKLENSKHEAKSIISNKADEGKSQKTEMAKEAQLKAVETISAAKEQLQKSKNEAQEILSNEVVDIAKNISSKIFGVGIDAIDVDRDFVGKIMKEENR